MAPEPQLDPLVDPSPASQATASSGSGQADAEKAEVKGYFETTGFERWNRIYSDSEDVNKVQRNIRIGHQKTVDNV
jgi:magnesium-protoporphyrin O-methyltransferase